MAKHALAHARNLELRAAIGVGTGYQGVGYRPIGLPQRTLLCGGRGKSAAKACIENDAPCEKNEILPFYQKAVAYMMRIDKGLFTGRSQP